MLLLTVEAHEPIELDEICQIDEVVEVFLIPCPIPAPLKPTTLPMSVSLDGLAGGDVSSGEGWVAFANLPHCHTENTVF